MNRKNILIADDVSINRAALAAIFKDDYAIFEAADGEEVLSMLKNENIDLVLLDIVMPKMDGFEVIKRMKAMPQYSAIPIVVTTAVGENSESEALGLGADDFVNKPYNAPVVRRRVANIMQKYVLQVENLKQALSHAEQLNRAKSEFLSRMSHEIRTPLNSVISTSAIMEENYDDTARVRELNKQIGASSRYLLGVINDVLDMSAIEHNKITLKKAPFDFIALLENIAAMFESQCRQKSITFTLNNPDGVDEYLFGDSLRLKQVLVNLIANSVKFTPEGGAVTFTVRQLSRAGDMVKLRFEVTDTGTGISPERLSRIWEPFEQENDTIAQTYGGSGLGLSIVRNIIELMGGTITVESEKGEGSSFVADIPFAVSVPLPMINNEKLKLVHAIIVDDDPETRAYAKTVLGKMQINCDAAESAEQALQMMEAAFENGNSYDICFVDWRLPGMGGVELTRAIRKRFADDTVIVIVSAYDTTEIENEAKMSGASAIVGKPMMQSTVYDLIMGIVGANYNKTEHDFNKYNFEGKHVLLAEDNIINSEVATELLKLVSCKVSRAADGAQAVEKFTSSKDGTYDAILMDIQMPVLDGHSAARQIRASAHPQAKTIPIIAVTANAFTKDVKESLAAGMNAHISKPIETDRLYSTLSDLFKENK